MTRPQWKSLRSLDSNVDSHRNRSTDNFSLDFILRSGVTGLISLQGSSNGKRAGGSDKSAVQSTWKRVKSMVGSPNRISKWAACGFVTISTILLPLYFRPMRTQLSSFQFQRRSHPISCDFFLSKKSLILFKIYIFYFFVY